MATISIGMAMIGIAGLYQAQSHGQSFPVAVSISPFKDEKYLTTTAISGPLPPDVNDFQKPATVELTPADMAAIFARDMADCDLVIGETYTWAEIQIQYRRYAKQHGWRMEIADRILSKALKDVGAIRGQRDLRAQGKGRPITFTFPGLGP
jgi:hypothetical protein